MSGIGPTGWSYSLNFASRLVAVRTPGPTQRPGAKPGPVYFSWAILRLALGVNGGLLFELLGAFLLAQWEYRAYDFRTHRTADAIVFSGTLGGLAIGIVLIVVDALLASSRTFADTEPRPVVPAGQPVVPHAGTVRNQAALRAILWPALGAGGSVVGNALWHLKENTRARPNASDRAGTAAVVGAVGAAVSVTAPSLIQLVLLIGAGASSRPRKA